MAGATNSGASAQMGLTVGTKLPAGSTHIVKQTRRLRTALEAAVVAAKGEVSIVDASAINVACRAEMSVKLAQKWLADHGGSMDHSERLSYLRALTTASEARHKAIASLRLDAPADPLAQLTAMFASEPPASSPEPHAVAAGAPEPTSGTMPPAEGNTGFPRVDPSTHSASAPQDEVQP